MGVLVIFLNKFWHKFQEEITFVFFCKKKNKKKKNKKKIFYLKKKKKIDQNFCDFKTIKKNLILRTKI